MRKYIASYSHLNYKHRQTNGILEIATSDLVIASAATCLSIDGHSLHHSLAMQQCGNIG